MIEISILWRIFYGKVAIVLHGFEANVLGYTLKQVRSSGTQYNSRKGDINIHVLPEFTSVREFSMWLPVSFVFDVQINMLKSRYCGDIFWGKVAIFLHGFEANVFGYTLEQVRSSGAHIKLENRGINIHILPEFTSVLIFFIWLPVSFALDVQSYMFKSRYCGEFCVVRQQYFDMDLKLLS